MKQLLLFFLFFSITLSITAQFKRIPGADPGRTGRTNDEYNPFSEGADTLYTEDVDTTDQIIYENTDTINFRRVVRKYNLNLERSEPEFSLDNVHRYQPVMQSNEPTINLGNNGLPITSLTYNPNYVDVVEFGLAAFEPYKLLDTDVNYYRAQRPFTKLFYASGSERENRFTFEHTQNWGRGLNVGVEYNRLVSDGFYDNQQIDHNNFAGHVWFQSKSKKFNTMAHYISNKYNVGANGGIENDENYFLNDDFSQRQSIPVRMATAESKFKGERVNLQNSYDFGQTITVEINDSIRDIQIVPRFRVQHTLNYGTAFNHFNSTINESDFFNATYINDTLPTLDTLDVQRITNEFRLKWLGNKLGDSSTLVRQNFLADAYAKHSFYTVQQLNNVEDDFSDVSVGGSFRSNPLDSATLLYKAEGAYHLLNYRQGDYYLRGEAGFNYNTIAGTLLGFIEINNQSQPYTANHFSQSHYRFSNDFDKMNARTIGGTYHNPVLNGRATVRYTNVTNALWYNEHFEPTVNSDAESYLFVQVNKQFHLNRFHLNVNGYYQTASDENTWRLPTWLANGEAYYKGPLFKNKVTAKIGLNGAYTSSYYVDFYDPALNQFVQQKDYRYSNDPQIGFFTNFSLSRARLFARLDNILAPINERPIMLGHYYPQHDLAFRVGIDWVFVN